MNVHGAQSLAVLFAGFLLASCATAPERPLEITTLENITRNQIEEANRAVDRGDYQGALGLLDAARQLAISTDKPELLIQEALSRGSALFYLGHIDEADTVWNNALAEAETTGNRILASLCRVYMARSRIFRIPEDRRAEREEEAAEVLVLVHSEMNALKDKRLYTALAWTVIGLAEKECRRYAEAEKALKNSLDIHTRERHLEQAAYDWYLLASVRSVAGQYAEAQAALKEALNYDRRAENSYGLGMDWLAIGDIHTKTGDTILSSAAYRRAALIFRSINLEADALIAEAKLAQNTDITP